MGRWSGALLIAAGVGVAGYVLPRSNEMTDDAVLAGRADAATVTAPARQGSPALVPDAAPPTAGVNRHSPAVVPEAAVTPSVVPSKPSAPTAASASRLNAYVAPTHFRSAPKAPLRTDAGAPPLDRARLTKALLVELKRVGCYGGPIGPVWTSEARKSMKTFTEFCERDAAGRSAGSNFVGDGAKPRGPSLRPGLRYRVGARPGWTLYAGWRHCGQVQQACSGPASGTAKLAVMGKGGPPAQSPPVAADTSAPLPMGRMSLAGPNPAPAVVDREIEIAAATLSPSPSGETGNADARLSKQPKKQRRTHNDRRTGSWPSKAPMWVPWAQPWAMN